MKWNLKRELFPLALIMTFVIVSVYYYPRLPETIPTHFDAHGVPNGYSSKLVFMPVMLGTCAAIYLLFTFLPTIDPLRKKIEARYTLVLFLRDVAMAFFLLIYILSIVAARTGTLDTRLLGLAVGVLFLLLGNYLPRVPQNWFIGIRSPWTLSSDIVWKKTHILGGWLFAIIGAMIIVLSLLKINLAYVIPGLVLPMAIFIAFIYPYCLYKKIQRESRPQQGPLEE